MIAFLPENLDLDEIVANNPPDFKYHIDNFKYLCSLISEVRSYRKEDFESDDFISLNSQKIQARVHEYKKYFGYLIQYSIIESDNHYIIGEKSIGYKFTTQFNVPLKAVVINKKSLIKNGKRLTEYSIRMQSKYDYLWRWFNPSLTIDLAGAMNFINNRYETEIKAGTKEALGRFNSSFISIHKFANHEFRFNIDTTAGRCHTNLTSLKRELRNFVKYDGKDLVAVDIKNSQPCFSGVLFNPKFYDTGKVDIKGGLLNIFRNRIAPKKLIKVNNINHLLLSPHMLEETTQINDYQCISKYLELCQTGKIYEFLGNEISRVTGADFSDRGKLKEVIFIALFTSNQFLGQPEAEPKRLFKNIFPNVYEVFSLIKKNDKTLLAKILQRIEAKVILNNAACRISKEFPKLPLFTIHDSIVVPRGNELYAARIIEEEMMIRVGMKPKVKYEYWKVNTESDTMLEMAA
jgi:ribosomal protein S8